MREAFYDPLTGFVGAEKLYHRLKTKNLGITRKEVKAFVAKQNVSQEFRRRDRYDYFGTRAYFHGLDFDHTADCSFSLMDGFKTSTDGKLGLDDLKAIWLKCDDGQY